MFIKIVLLIFLIAIGIIFMCSVIVWASVGGAHDISLFLFF